MTDTYGAVDDIAQIEADLAAANQELRLDLAQAALDAAGIIDPTPASDLAGASLSLYRGDLVGAGLSLISVVPYVGDAIGKTAKGAALLKKIAVGKKRVAGLISKLKKAQAASKAAAKMRALTAAATKMTAAKTSALMRCPQNATKVAKSRFVAQGMSRRAREQYLATPEGQRLLDRLHAADPNAPIEQIEKRAYNQLRTMKTAPVASKASEPLVKIVPSGQQVSGHSPFFATHAELEKAKASGRPLPDYFGLPASSHSANYDIYEIAPTRPTEVLSGTVAPTTELFGQIRTSGGGQQVLVSDRSAWSAPRKIGKFP